MYSFLNQTIKYFKGVGPYRASLLEKEAGIMSVEDLLRYYPNKYIDRTRVYKVQELEEGMASVQVIGQLLYLYETGIGRRKRLEGVLDDGTGTIRLVWFGGIGHMKKVLQLKSYYVVFGKPSLFREEMTMSHPEISLYQGAEALASQSRLHPAYPMTEAMRNGGVTSALLEQLVLSAFQHLRMEDVPDTLPKVLLHKYELMGLYPSLKQIHLPSDNDLLEQARHRLKFEELFYVQLEILDYAHKRTRSSAGLRFPLVGSVFHLFYREHLPFALTEAQKRVVREIWADMNSGLQMNRLLQGDVGSGKTLVALMSMLIAQGNGYQSCMMAPTEILAEQHYNTLMRFLEGMDIHVALLTGSVQGKRRTSILQEVSRGEVNILVGTHALLGDKVDFHQLGLAVIDEQHRFGVEQRASLWKKNSISPHILVMTATPIPRTLAMTVYGDLTVSVIDELPPGRKPVKTCHGYHETEKDYLQLVASEIQKGRQAYFVYPLIEESEKSDMLDLESGYQHLCEVFPQWRIGRLHGKMKDSEKNSIMEEFKAGKMDVLVSTTVIEVGVDVPNASVMVVMNANRFGLSQLHQLRGRVGRGADQSYCLLVTGYQLSETSRRRIEIMLESSDGFYIAEEDLKLRGPGVLDGTQQSGVFFDLKLSNVIRDGDLMAQARNAAMDILSQDPDKSLPSYAIVWDTLAKMRKNRIDLSNIS